MANGIPGNTTGPAFTVLATHTKQASFGSPGVSGLRLLGQADSISGETATKTWAYGVRYEGTEGTPTAPCVALDFYGSWRFRWLVGAGSRSITVYAKQASNVANRPSVVLKANSAVGLNADVTSVAASSTGWVAITASFVATATGMVWVELHNNAVAEHRDACFFDRISVI